MKNSLTMSGMVESVRSVFNKVSCSASQSAMPITDCLMAGLSIFSLKFPSLLQYDRDRYLIKKNIKNLFGIPKLPSDTYMRERPDDVSSRELRSCFIQLFSAVQRPKKLEAFQHNQVTEISGSTCDIAGLSHQKL